MLATRIRSMGGAHWIAFFAVILTAWGVLFAMAVSASDRAFEEIYGAEFWAMLCTVSPDAAGFARLTLMWALMSLAMMLPTALPAFATYDDLTTTGAETDFPALVGGYMTVWVGFSVAAAGLQMALFQADLVGAYGTSRSSVLTAGLLALAGLYQFSALKEACATACRAPLTQFMAHWASGPWRMGVRMGAACLGCCWALMLLAFVGGTMNIAFMGLATVIMTLEKLPDLGRHLTAPLGVALLVAAGLVAIL